MKPTLKTTALAMCIALSLTACKSTSNSGDARPTPVQPEAAKAEAAAKEEATKPAASSYNYEKESTLEDHTEWRTSNVKHDKVQNTLSSTFDNSSKSFNLNALSKNQLGKHEGTIDANGYVLSAYNGPKPLKGELKYDFVNQPYSSYGVVYSSEERNGNHDFEKLFYLAVVDGKSSDLVNATYNGKVFAKVKLSNSDEERYARTTIGEDGDVTLNVQKNSSGKFEMSGNINSTTVGRIDLSQPKEIKENKVNGHVDFGDEAGGSYSATISKNGSDIVGHVDYIRDKASGLIPTVEGKDGEIKYLFGYEAVFGATKQPK